MGHVPGRSLLLWRGVLDVLTREENSNSGGVALESNGAGTRLQKAMSLEWLGQTGASLCWIASVLTYGISSNGDWLQLFAASSWLIANLSVLAAFNPK